MLKFLLVVILFAVATYFLVRTLQERGAAPGGGQGGTRPRRAPRGPRTPPRIIAPDDDEDFLRDLDRKRKNPDDSDS
ncbi:hypothetical protein GCM10027020_26280 [Nocardioides salsibiostraticola]